MPNTTIAAPTTKRCRVCERELSIDDFSPDVSKRDGLRSECRECYTDQQRTRRAARLGPRCEACGSTASRCIDLDENGEVRGTLCRPCKAIATMAEQASKVLEYLESRRDPEPRRSGRVWSA